MIHFTLKPTKSRGDFFFLNYYKNDEILLKRFFLLKVNNRSGILPNNVNITEWQFLFKQCFL